MPDSQNTAIVIYYTFAYLLAVLSPLIPAILIYRLFPDTKVTISGPLAGLTLKAGGAFAAYVVTFLLSMSIMSHFRNTLDSFVTPVWRVTGQLALVDENENPVTDAELLNAATVEFMPSPNQEKFGQMQLTVPISNSTWPHIHIGLGQGGSAELEYPFQDFDPKSNGRSISLRKPVKIKLHRAAYQPAGSPQ
jgi:hypothetical protein